MKRAKSPSAASRSESQDANTVTRLLDAAERLFGEHGFDGIGIRALTTDAGVNLGACTFHFGSKEQLYVEAFLRRFRPIQAMRMQMLEAAQAAAASGTVPLEKILECMLRPPFENAPAHPHFLPLLARNLFQPPPFMRAVLQKELKGALERFLPALQRALPGVPPEVLATRMHFCGGALLFHIAHHQKAISSAAHPASGLTELIHFCAAGFRAGFSAAPALSPVRAAKKARRA
jgi:AcrR family transcriptional regulator